MATGNSDSCREQAACRESFRGCPCQLRLIFEIVRYTLISTSARRLCLVDPVPLSRWMSSAPRAWALDVRWQTFVSVLTFTWFLIARTAKHRFRSLFRGWLSPGYSFYAEPLQSFIKPPGEPQAPVRCGFYAQNYFRVLISDFAVQFYREAALPSDLADGERQLVAAIFDLLIFGCGGGLVLEKIGTMMTSLPYRF